MDIVLVPINAPLHPLIPDLGGPEFDNLGFQGYDLRQGWDAGALRRGDLTKARQDWSKYPDIDVSEDSLNSDSQMKERLANSVIGPFVQTWILYGILQEALRRPVSRHEVSMPAATTKANESAEECLTTYITLREVFEEFLGNIPAIQADRSWASTLAICLHEAALTLERIDTAAGWLGSSLIPTPVYLGLSILVQSLIHHGMRFCQPHFGKQNQIWGCRPLERTLMIDHGWCPSLVRRVSDLGFDALAYANLVPRLGHGQTHHDCNSKVCLSSNIDPETYRTQHIAEHCKCANTKCTHMSSECCCTHFAMSKTAMTQAFVNNGYPLVKLEEDSVRVIQYKPGVKYVAISHVWSDGKGNGARNSLPQCQLKSIHQYVSALHIDQNTLFWIDTLCVPVNEPLRNTAIMRMAQVYSAATKVLVLSNELLATHLPPTVDEVLFFVACSKWMTRLWTMQESALACDMVFQFSDSSVRYSDLNDNMVREYFSLRVQSRVMGWRAHWVIDFVASMKGEEPDPLDFWEGIKYRSTSRLSDAAICGSILLDSGLARVLSVPDEQKIQAFWSCQKQVSTGVLYSEGSRLREDGFR